MVNGREEIRHGEKIIEVLLCSFRYVPGHGFGLAMQMKFPNFLHRGVK
jgi:hypothetical protein